MTKQALGKDLDPQPGDILLLQIEGVVGKLVWLMQLLNRDASRWTHAGVALDDGTLFEAQPGGAVITPLSEYDERPMAVVTRYQTSAGLADLTPVLSSEVRQRISDNARTMLGVGYNWGTYAYLAAYRFGVRPGWLKRRVQDDQRMICSQAADQAYYLSGVNLFADGRMPYDVTPGDLARLL